MNGYLARLMQQSALRIAQGDADTIRPAFTPASDSAAPAPDIVEEETLGEAPVSSQPAIPYVRARDPQSVMIAPPLGTNETPGKRESDGEATPPLASLRPTQPIRADEPAAAAIPFVSIGSAKPSGSPNEQMPAAKPLPLTNESPASEEIAPPTPGAQEIIHEVVAWVTDTRRPVTEVESTGPVARPSLLAKAIPARATTESQEDNRKRSPSPADESGEVDRPERSAFHSVETRSSAPPTARAEPWSVQIDSIHLSIEEPPAKSAVPPVVPRAAPPAASSSSPFTPSQLRRHYLRPF